jgi:hypothetical protein
VAREYASIIQTTRSFDKAGARVGHGHVKVEGRQVSGFWTRAENGEKRLVWERQSQESVEKQEGKGGRRQKDPVRAKPAEQKC